MNVSHLNKRELTTLIYRGFRKEIDLHDYDFVGCDISGIILNIGNSSMQNNLPSGVTNAMIEAQMYDDMTAEQMDAHDEYLALKRAQLTKKATIEGLEQQLAILTGEYDNEESRLNHMRIEWEF